LQGVLLPRSRGAGTLTQKGQGQAEPPEPGKGQTLFSIPIFRCVLMIKANGVIYERNGEDE